MLGHCPASVTLKKELPSCLGNVDVNPGAAAVAGGNAAKVLTDAGAGAPPRNGDVGMGCTGGTTETPFIGNTDTLPTDAATAEPPPLLGTPDTVPGIDTGRDNCESTVSRALTFEGAWDTFASVAKSKEAQLLSLDELVGCAMV